MIFEAITNNGRVISQLTSKVERIVAQSKEQQLKLAGAAFDALRYASYVVKKSADLMCRHVL